MNVNALQRLRDLVGRLCRPLNKQNEYRRFSIGQKVRFVRPDMGIFDSGEIVGTRTAGVYVIRDEDFQNHLVEWQSIRPV